MSSTDKAKQHYNRGVELEEQGKLEEAVSDYRAAIDSQPDCAEYRNDLGSALWALERREEALAEYAKAAQIEPQRQVLLKSAS